MSRILNFDPTAVYTAAQLLDGAGFGLGDRVHTPMGEFVLSEAKADIARYQTLVVPATALFTVANMTYTAAAKTLYILDCGAALAAGRLVGLDAFIYDDDSDPKQGGSVRIKSHPVLVSGQPITITLEEAYPTALGANPDLKVYDPNYVEKSLITGILQYCVGVAPVAVDQSVAPFFWRQVSGVCKVIMDDTAAAPEPITLGAAIAGQAKVNATANGSDAHTFATVIEAAPSANKLALVRLWGTLS